MKKLPIGPFSQIRSQIVLCENNNASELRIEDVFFGGGGPHVGVLKVNFPSLIRF